MLLVLWVIAGLLAAILVVLVLILLVQPAAPPSVHDVAKMCDFLLEEITEAGRKIDRLNETTESVRAAIDAPYAEWRRKQNEIL